MVKQGQTVQVKILLDTLTKVVQESYDAFNEYKNPQDNRKFLIEQVKVFGEVVTTLYENQSERLFNMDQIARAIQVQVAMQEDYIAEIEKKMRDSRARFGVIANSKPIEDAKQRNLEMAKQQFSCDDLHKDYAELQQNNSAVIKREKNFMRKISNQMKKYLDKISNVLTPNPLEGLWESLPLPTQRGTTWPKLDDLKKLDYDQLKNYKLTKFEFWDYSKNTSELSYNIAFRLYSSENQKSDIKCSVFWLKAPESYNQHLTSFSLEKISKIEVYYGT